MLTTHPLSADSELVSNVLQFYGDDFQNKDCPLIQLYSIHTSSDVALTDLSSIVSYLKSLDSASQCYFSEVIKLLKLILVIPATNAVSERSFSALRRLKSWLRTTITQACLNWCMILHVHKERTDSLNMDIVANDFVSQNSSRMNIFSKF